MDFLVDIGSGSSRGFLRVSHKRAIGWFSAMRIAMYQARFLAKLGFVVAGACWATEGLPQCTIEESSKVLPIAGLDGFFGSSLAVSDDWVVCGDEMTGFSERTGGVFVYERGLTGELANEKLLVPSQAQRDDLVGLSVALDNGRILVGAPRDSSIHPNAGTAYLYEYDGLGWVQTAEFTPSLLEQNLSFGWSVALRDDLAVIGAPRFYSLGRGLVFVFRFDGSEWVEEQFLESDLPEWPNHDLFGSTVGISKETVLVGASTNDCIHFEPGRVYVFSKEGSQWKQIQTLFPSDSAQLDDFGWTLAVNGSSLIVGVASPFFGFEEGAAYVFRHDGFAWIEQQRLEPSDPQPDDRFSRSLAILGDVALVGDPAWDDSATGAVYVYGHKEDVWTELRKVVVSNPGVPDWTGWSVALDRGAAITGATRYGNRGAVLRFPASSEPFVLQIQPALPSEGETIEFLTSCGSPSGETLLAAVGVNENPLFLPITFGSFGDDGTWLFSSPVPGGVDGFTVEFQSYGIQANGSVGESNRSVVVFQ